MNNQATISIVVAVDTTCSSYGYVENTMIWIVLFSVLSIYLLYTTLKTERQVAKPGKDLRLNLSIGFYDAILGCETEVKIPRMEAISENVAIPVIRLLKITVPPGIAAGNSLRLPGEGDASKNGGRAGDLFIHILTPLNDGELFRKGLDIESEVAITQEQALLGCELVVRTIWGDLSIAVPPRTNQGDTLVLKGYGVPRPESPTKKGNHIIHFFCQEQEFNHVSNLTASDAVMVLPEPYLGDGWGEGI
jgi:DnaJ-class molecular chaperone